MVVAMPLPLDDNGNPLTRVYIPTGNLPLDNSTQGSPDGSADPNAIGVNASDVQMPTKDSIIDKLLGTNGVERYQLWPEKLIRDALSAPAQVMQPNPYKEGTEENLAFENLRQSGMPQAALNMSALAGTGGLAGVGAEAGTSLGAGPFLRPALKYEGKIYKAPVGGQHMDAIPKDLQPEFTRQAMSGEDISNFDFGFMNHKGHFLNREDALKYAIDNGLLNPHDAKYGALTSTMDLPKPSLVSDFIPAVKDPKTGKIYSNENSHISAMANLENDVFKRIYNDKNSGQGFIDKNGNYISRQDFKNKYGIESSKDLTSTLMADSSKEAAAIDASRPYANAPDSLMGFKKNGQNKSFDETNYKFKLPVKVTFPDTGDTFIDTIKGLNKSHALERANRNWKGANIEALEGQ